MPDEYLTIKEAAAEIGKAEITVRRFVQRIVKGSDSNRRSLLRPTPEELAELREGPPPAWRISIKLLREHFATQGQGSGQSTQTIPKQPEDQVVSVLQSQIDSMERQLLVKDEQIKSMTMLVDSLGNQLNERLREGNFLMKGLQERMALPAPVQSSIIEAQSPKQSSKSESSKAVGESKPKRSEKRKTKKGWLNRLFGDDQSAK